MNNSTVVIRLALPEGAERLPQLFAVRKDARVAPVGREQPSVGSGGETVVQQQDNAAVLRAADDPACRLKDLVHAGKTVGKIVAGVVFLLEIFPQNLLLCADLGQTGADDGAAQQLFSL